MDKEEAGREILDRIKEDNVDREDINDLKMEVCSKYKIKPVSNRFLLSLMDDISEELKKKLMKRPTRTISGITPVAVITKPDKCSHGTCIYCPKGKGFPQSYSGKEPAIMRGNALDYNSYRQVRRRLEQLKTSGHVTDKVELIVMGGTFTSKEMDYQKEFIKGCFDGLNNYKAKNLEESLRKNETSDNRCVGLTIETRPDEVSENMIRKILEYGTTRVEIGVQIPDNEIYKKINRGHNVQDVVGSTRRLKDSGLKVLYHYMPGLPGSNIEKDFKYFKELFENEKYRPDMLKIYPTLVMKGTELEKMYENGNYFPYTDPELIDLLCRMKEIVPKYVRIMHLNRDFPSEEVVAGCRKNNLRQLVRQEMERKNKECGCIRCREIGHAKKRKKLKDLNPDMEVMKYNASGGKEYFISFEDESEDVLFGFIRLRIPEDPFMKELNREIGLIRELHIYGSEIRIGNESDSAQHRGYGKRLLKKAERIAEREGMDKIAITSGVGVREYYRKFGYKLVGPYMIKVF
ncbi:MAG: tRNA uridine(34) 5-carboxymethylaminomethyl modification radical SAM/GNAT enzyme Elp3 [Candidatus Aenigmatarchaeota archaeon]